MSWLDAILILPLLYGLVRGLMKGFISEVMAVLAIILGCVGARLWGNGFAHWLHSQWQWPDAVCTATSYVLLFIAIAIVLSIVAKLLSRFFNAINLGGLNRLLGGVFGIAKWGLITLVIVFGVSVLDQQFHFLPQEALAQAKLYPTAIEWANTLWQSVASNID
ncbi:MAG: CvpA family protein [Paludibacteraceae bacterium]|nr:CvpA family protein [Paludibacteraceae bacterium]